MATPMLEATRRWASRVEFSAITAKTTSPGLRRLSPSLRGMSLHRGKDGGDADEVLCGDAGVAESELEGGETLFMFTHALGEEEARGDHVHAQLEDPPEGDAGMRRWAAIRRPLLRGTCQSYHSGAGVWAAAGRRWGKCGKMEAAVGGAAQGRRRGVGGLAGIGGGKRLKMPLSWCNTETNAGENSVIF